MRLPFPSLLLGSIVLVSGCADTNTSDNPVAPSPAPTRSVQSAAPSEQAAVDELTRLVALALSDAGLRHRVRNDLRDSRHTREHKLHLTSYLRGQSGGILLAKMVKESGTERDSVLALLGRVRPLEFYMPVAAHRDTWRGGPDLLVGNLLNEKTGSVTNAPSAYSLSGGRVVLSADAPPATPTLALVPVETDFTAPLDSRYRNRNGGSDEVIGTLCQECIIEDPGYSTGGGGGTSEPAGLYMTFSYLRDLGENWIKGDPEIEVHVHGPKPSSSDLTKADDLSCAGDRRSFPRRFNQDGNSWNGSVLLFTQTEIEQYNAVNSQGFNVLFWEDDDTECAVRTDKSLTNELLAGAVGMVYGGALVVTNCTPITCTFGGGFFIGGVYHMASFLQTNDDYLGAGMFTAGSPYSYADANIVIKNGSSVNGRAMLVTKN